MGLQDAFYKMNEIHEIFQWRVILEKLSILNFLLFTALSIFGSSLSYFAEVWRTEEERYTSMASWVEAEEFVP